MSIKNKLVNSTALLLATTSQTVLAAGDNPVQKLDKAAQDLTPQIKVFAFTFAGLVLTLLGVITITGSKGRSWAMSHLPYVLGGLILISGATTLIAWAAGLV